MRLVRGLCLVLKALIFAIWSHRGQKRKYTGEAYVWHPIAVAWEVYKVEDSTWEMVAAALLHDVVEDCNVDSEVIFLNFGWEVGELVYWLTDVSIPEDGNRITRKALDRQHTSEAPAKAQTIKLADLINNSESIEKHDKDFAVVFMKEMNLLLDVLTEGDKGLYNKTVQIVTDYYFKTKVG